jgi:hypothetical protein
LNSGSSSSSSASPAVVPVSMACSTHLGLTMRSPTAAGLLQLPSLPCQPWHLNTCYSQSGGSRCIVATCWPELAARPQSTSPLAAGARVGHGTFPPTAPAAGGDAFRVPLGSHEAAVVGGIHKSRPCLSPNNMVRQVTPAPPPPPPPAPSSPANSQSSLQASSVVDPLYFYNTTCARLKAPTSAVDGW